MSDRTHFVYEAFDADGVLLYVGCTGNPSERYGAHMRGDSNYKGWFHPFVTHWFVSGPYARPTAVAIEKRWIAEHDPIWNTTGFGRRDRRRINEYLDFHGVEFVKVSGTYLPELRGVA